MVGLLMFELATGNEVGGVMPNCAYILELLVVVVDALFYSVTRLRSAHAQELRSDV